MSKYAGQPLTDALNMMAGTDDLAATGAANVWAGSVGLSLLAALNAKASTSGLGMGAVLNALSGSHDLGEFLAGLRIPDEAGLTYADLLSVWPSYAAMSRFTYEELV